jgi:hypothetical protein
VSGKPSLVDNDTSVRLLREFMADTLRGADSVPSLVKDICRKGRWKVRVDEQTGQRYEFETFAEFVTTGPLRGLGSTIETLEKLCAGDAEAMGALEKAMQRKSGNPTGRNQHSKEQRGTFDIVQGSSPAPTGNSAARSLRKLRTEAEKSAEVKAVYARVLAGELSPHRGMVECGFRKVPTAADIIRREWKRLSPKERRALLKELQVPS